MKTAFWGLVLVIAGVALFGLGWVSHAKFSRTPMFTVLSHSTPMISNLAGSPGVKAVPFAHLSSPFVTPDERQMLNSARQTVLQSNPDLAAEYKSILDDMKAQQAKINAAMIKIDPKVAGIMAKMDALRQHNQMPIPSAGTGPR